MARRTFDVIDICEIFVHWHAGRSKNEVAGSLGLSRNTVRKYVAAAESAGMVPGGPAVSQEEWARLAREWFPELADTRLRQVTWPAIGEHRDYIVAQLEAGVTVATIHQRLRDERGLAVSVASLRRYVAANLPEEVRRSQVRVLSLHPAVPGEQAQIDYGQLGRWADPVTGRVRAVWAFAMVLCCSRHMFVRPVITMDQQAWTECHVAAFGFFGGVPARLVPDNLKTGVDRPDLYDPKINRSYAELAAHYGCLVDPARPRPPRSSGCPAPAGRQGIPRAPPDSSRCSLRRRLSAHQCGTSCRRLERTNAPAATARVRRVAAELSAGAPVCFCRLYLLARFRWVESAVESGADGRRHPVRRAVIGAGVATRGGEGDAGDQASRSARLARSVARS